MGHTSRMQPCCTRLRVFLDLCQKYSGIRDIFSHMFSSASYPTTYKITFPFIPQKRETKTSSTLSQTFFLAMSSLWDSLENFDKISPLKNTHLLSGSWSEERFTFICSLDFGKKKKVGKNIFKVQIKNAQSQMKYLLRNEGKHSFCSSKQN